MCWFFESLKPGLCAGTASLYMTSALWVRNLYLHISFAWESALKREFNRSSASKRIKCSACSLRLLATSKWKYWIHSAGRIIQKIEARRLGALLNLQKWLSERFVAPIRLESPVKHFGEKNQHIPHHGVYQNQHEVFRLEFEIALGVPIASVCAFV